jgi:hypothetical protein
VSSQVLANVTPCESTMLLLLLLLLSTMLVTNQCVSEGAGHAALTVVPYHKQQGSLVVRLATSALCMTSIGHYASGVADCLDLLPTDMLPTVSRTAAYLQHG